MTHFEPMAQVNKRHLPLTGGYNFRDLGGYRTRSGALTKWRRLLRADSPHRLTQDDISRLLDAGLSTVIDLRSDNEIDSAPNPFAARTDVDYRNVRFFDHLAPDTMQTGQTTPNDDPLFGFYVSALATRKTAIGEVLRAIANARDGAVMFHCTAGKDRTGLIAALLLGLADVEEDEIVSDYAQTKPLIAGLVEEFLDLARQNGTDLASYRRLLACDAQTMRRVVNHIREEYQSASGFAAQTGLQPELVARLTGRLLD